MPEAARKGDSIGHSSAMGGLLTGIVAGVVLAAAVVAVVGTGGVAAVAIGAGIAAAGASGGLAGEYIGEAIQSSTGTIITGSSDTFHEGKPAARAKLDMVDCSRHGRNRIAEGSKTVGINGQPAARRGDHTECGAVIMSGAKSIMIGGPSIQVLPVRQEVPTWLHNSLIAVAIGGTIIATGGAAAVFGIGPAAGGLIGGLAGGWSLGWVGGKVGQAVGEHFGNPELGKRIGEVSGGVIGSFAGGYVGTRIGTPKGVNLNHLAEMKANGVKYSPNDVIATGRSSSGQVVFLERGNNNAGLEHIIEAHGEDFANIGVPEAKIPDVVVQAVTQGKLVGYQGAGTGRPIYEIIINGQPQRIAVTTGNNGFIVGANPAGSGR